MFTPCLHSNEADIMTTLWRQELVGRLLKKWTLANGVVLEVHDESAQYYADFWNLKVVISGTVEIKPQYLQAIRPATPSEQEAKEALGSEAVYCRELTRIGVREAEKEETIQRLLASFEWNTLPYLNHPAFPERLVRHQWQKRVEELTEQEVDGG
jgi:hypothetical protein